MSEIRIYLMSTDPKDTWNLIFEYDAFDPQDPQCWDTNLDRSDLEDLRSKIDKVLTEGGDAE